MFPLKSLARIAVAIALPIAIFGSCSADNAPPTGPGDPPPQTTFKWSDPNSWPSKAVPVANQDVVVPAGESMILDITPPALKSLVINGSLTFADTDLALSANYVQVKGTLVIGSEQKPYTHRATITLTGDDSNEGALGLASKALSVSSGAALELHGAPRVVWTHLSATAPKGATTLMLERGVDWRAGDNIVLASTDFDPAQAEPLVVQSVSSSQVTVTTALKYAHWGVMQSVGGASLDERAEIGLLSRNITVRGNDECVTAGYCGHVIVFQGGIAHVEGIELYQMGQKSKLARYPFHWHVAGDVTGQYIRNSSIWNTFNRCVTVHGTNMAVVSGNICYHHLGHGYFLEDGVEHGNTITNNLGILAMTPVAGQEVLASDRRPATFWITNPDNTYTGDVAAGSMGVGFWIALPEHPTGLSSSEVIWPRRTQFTNFSNNTAHSNRSTGMNVDDGPKADGTTEVTFYNPRVDPTNGGSAVAVTTFDHFTAYKNRQRGAWLRGANMRLTHAMLADNDIGATFAANETFLQDATIIGESGNNATTLGTYPIRGYEFYDGRVGAERVQFINFASNATRPASAYGYNRNNAFSINTQNYTNGATFVNSNHVYLENPHPDKDGDKAAVFLDADGSVTGTTGAHVAANMPILLDGTCSNRVEWNAFVCRGAYGLFSLNTGAATPENIAPMTIVRDDNVSGAMAGSGGSLTSINMSLLSGRKYKLQPALVPSKPRLYWRDAAVGDNARIGFPWTNPSVKVWRDYDSGHPIAAAASLSELDASTGNVYFFDTANSMMYVKLQVQANRTYSTVFIDPL
ncbi:MAG: transmembrane domain-containing protein [Gemmatimonadaceae bacterium]|nr:transmembrane domain-containing protein [Gemmatimonadaceae bacterium]